MISVVERIIQLRRIIHNLPAAHICFHIHRVADGLVLHILALDEAVQDFALIPHVEAHSPAALAGAVVFFGGFLHGDGLPFAFRGSFEMMAVAFVVDLTTGQNYHFLHAENSFPDHTVVRYDCIISGDVSKKLPSKKKNAGVLEPAFFTGLIQS